MALVVKHCKICGKELNDKSSIFYMMEECSDCVWKRGEITILTKRLNYYELESFLSEKGIDTHSCTFMSADRGGWLVKIPIKENVEVLKDTECVKNLKNEMISEGFILSEIPEQHPRGILIPADPKVGIKYNR